MDKGMDGSAGASPTLRVQTSEYIAKQDAALNKRAGWEQNAIGRLVESLLKGSVEVGWRESCGTTDPTHHIYRAWVKVLPKLKKDGLTITEERQKHGNGWATKGGGFWNSIVYRLETSEASAVNPPHDQATINQPSSKIAPHQQESNQP